MTDTTRKSAIDTAPRPHARIGLWDAVSIIIGIVVGTAIFKSPTMVFQCVSGPAMAMLVWLLGGVLSLMGALCYAELATTYPEAGGDYQYLRRAYGPWMGFLFGWAQLSVILTGSIAAMACSFAEYFQQAFGADHIPTAALAVAPIVLLSAANLLGVLLGTRMQNLLSAIKIAGLLAIVLAGVLVGGGVHASPPAASGGDASLGLGLAMVFVLYAYGGWNDAAFVASEVLHPSKNIPRALLLSTCGITLVYLLVNGAYLRVLGFAGAQNSWTPAADLMRHVAGDAGGRAISILVVACTLGAINGLILTGSRVCCAFGKDHRLFHGLSHWHARWRTPARAIVAQGVIALGLVCLVGTLRGQWMIDQSLVAIGLRPLPWQTYYGGFETLVAGTAPVFWAFFLLTGISQVVLRWRDPQRYRPFVTPCYPIPTMVFVLTSLYMLYASVSYAKSLSLIGIVPLLLGVPLYLLSERKVTGVVDTPAPVAGAPPCEPAQAEPVEAGRPELVGAHGGASWRDA